MGTSLKPIPSSDVLSGISKILGSSNTSEFNTLSVSSGLVSLLTGVLISVSNGLVSFSTEVTFLSVLNVLSFLTEIMLTLSGSSVFSSQSSSHELESDSSCN